jgi:ABC-type branched-subunit amino acid transport system ATPase component
VFEAHAVEFAYGSVQVLFGVDLRVDAGEIVALVGTNGAGKSTVLDLLAGLWRPSAGTIALDGEDVTGVDAVGMVQRGVVLVQGGRAVFPDLSVIDNLQVGLPARRLGATAVRRRAAELLDGFPSLHGLAERRAGTLSAGEQQQLALAKGLLHEPRVLLVDELTLGLAPEAKHDVIALVQRVHAGGTTVVLVEQDLDVALAVAPRAVFLEKGAVAFDGPAAELRDRDDLVRAVFLGVTSG